MNPDIHAELLPLLVRDFRFKESKKSGGTWLQGGECPVCSKKELFTNKEHPWVLRCGRLNNCGAEIHVKDRYPDLFDHWSNRYQKTEAAPNAAADAYLRTLRGFDISRIAGTYTQEWYFDNEKKIGSATVRFPMGGNDYWERLIDQPSRFGKKKAHFNWGAEYQGKAWAPPMPLPHDEMWVVEGIFNSIALMHHDIYAASAMSCSNYPHLFLQSVIEQCEAAGRERPALVWALDDGKAGTTYAKKHHERALKEGWKSSCVLIKGRNGRFPDWNDQHLADRLKPEDIAEYRYQGSLLTARSAADKALLIYKRKNWAMFYFDFENRLNWFEFDAAKYNAAYKAISEEKKESGLDDKQLRDLALEASRTVREIANCLPTALYYQANTLTDESWYYVRIDFPHDGRAVKNTFTGGQLSSATEFKKRLLAIAPGALYTGNALHLDIWLQKQMFGIKTVQTIDYIGYTKEHGAWVFDALAVKGGSVHELNDEDFFDLGKLSIKSLNKSVDLRINPDMNDYDASWLKFLWDCFGAKGLVALAYWLGSLFAEQIRDLQESYPFLEISGEPNAGKSTLIEFLWKLCGRTAYEGFDPQKATVAARARNFAQVANLPIVLIESDRESGEGDRIKQKGFDWDELKTAFNGRSVRSTGVKNGGNDTREPPFRGALVISQNAKVAASDAFMQRVMQIWLEAKPVTEESRVLFKKLASFPVKHCSQFILRATQAEEQILKTLTERYTTYVKVLDDNKNVKQQRLIHNHAQLMALTDALRHLVKFSDDAHLAVLDEIIAMAETRQLAINTDNPKVQQFWEVFDYIEDRAEPHNRLNHSRKDGTIAVNLNEFIAKADTYRQQIPDMNDIKKLLRTSRARKFEKANVTVNSEITGRSVKCWVFREDPSYRPADD